jgi:Txe/YoeB family toxin of Txe-Axe toxin-antitoxin module
VTGQGPEWAIEFFMRHGQDDALQSVPGREFLDQCPAKVAATMVEALRAVARAPPPAFSGGGYWEPMHGSMKGYYEVRVNGPKRRHYRLFCLLERDGAQVGLSGPTIVIITGMDKPFRTEFSDAEYRQVRKLGDEYRARIPRSVAP